MSRLGNPDPDPLSMRGELRSEGLRGYIYVIDSIQEFLFRTGIFISSTIIYMV